MYTSSLSSLYNFSNIYTPFLIYTPSSLIPFHPCNHSYTLYGIYIYTIYLAQFKVTRSIARTGFTRYKHGGNRNTKKQGQTPRQATSNTINENIHTHATLATLAIFLFIS